jgi:diguanylate cyclase (GGDEF)-like protein
LGVDSASAADPSRRSWLCRDGLELERFLGTHERTRTWNRRGLAVLAVVLAPAIPSFSPWSLIPLALAAGAYGFVDLRFAAFRRPEVAIVAALIIAQAMIVAAIVINGRQHLGDLALLMWPVVGLSAAYPGRVVAAGTAYASALMLVASLAFDGAVVLHDPVVLCVPLGLLLAVSTLTSALRENEVEQRGAAIVDELTGMLNRAALANRSLELAHQSAMTGRPAALIVGDVDHFKAVNDAYGHATGDVVLRQIAQSLRTHQRAEDLAYRLGGEEFVVLLPGGDLERAAALAERLRRAVGGRPVGGVTVTMSFGVAATAPGERFEFAQVFARADAALYEAKRGGRNRVCGGEQLGRSEPAAEEPLYGPALYAAVGSPT